jgi:hypothetical protein
VGVAPKPEAIPIGRLAARRGQQAEMDQRPAAGLESADQDMRIGIAREQCALEEHHRDRPYRRRAAEPGQHHFCEHRLDREQQEGRAK